jgi:hypothetical protein
MPGRALAADSARPTADSCGSALAAQRSTLSRVPIEKRLGPTLALIGRSCAGLDAALADAATKAAGLKLPERARVLGAAQRACTAEAWERPAELIEKSCAPRHRDPQGIILRKLDAGTYAFVRALRAKLEAAKAPQAAELVLSDLALSATMELP